VATYPIPLGAEANAFNRCHEYLYLSYFGYGKGNASCIDHT